VVPQWGIEMVILFQSEDPIHKCESLKDLHYINLIQLTTSNLSMPIHHRNTTSMLTWSNP
jgi:hypothetical protein